MSARRALGVLSRQHTLACLALLRCRALARCFLSPLVKPGAMQFRQDFSGVLKTAKQLATEAIGSWWWRRGRIEGVGKPIPGDF